MKKINLGVVLIILTLVAMVGYLIYEKNFKKGDIDKVRAFINDYFKVYNKYSLLYEEDREIDKVIDKSKYDKYKEGLKQELNKYLINDEDLRVKVYDSYNKIIDEQIEGKYIYNKNEKSISDENDKENPYHNMSKSLGIVYYKHYMIVNVILKDDVNKVSRISEIYNKEIGKYEGETKSQVGIGYILEHLVLKEVKGELKLLVHTTVNPINYTFENQNNSGIVSLI